MYVSFLGANFVCRNPQSTFFLSFFVGCGVGNSLLHVAVVCIFSVSVHVIFCENFHV